MDNLPELLAREARRLNLSLPTLEGARVEVVLAFTARVLDELAARGLLPGDEVVGCHARPRSGEN